MHDLQIPSKTRASSGDGKFSLEKEKVAKIYHLHDQTA